MSSLVRPRWVSASSKRALSLVCYEKRWDLSTSHSILSANYSVRTSPGLRSMKHGFTSGVGDCSKTKSHHVDHGVRFSMGIRHLHYYCRSSASGSLPIWIFPERRLFSTDNMTQSEEAEKQSNRAAFKSTPIIPSILAYIEKIGVGMRKKKSKHNKHKLRRRSPHNGAKGKGGHDTLDEVEEFDYFVENDKQHRVQRQNKEENLSADRGRGNSQTRFAQKSKKSFTNNNKEESSENKGAYWLPPPPFSSFVRGQNDAQDDSLNGKKIIRRPVKLLGNAGSLKDKLPREIKSLAEVAIAGRSNVGKSTLLNAILYGNTDVSLSPRKFQRGATPDRNKLPRGVKAVTSPKPGQTKELSFYRLTADVVTENDSDEEEKEKAMVEKMSLLLVDLPGYGFAFAKEERTVEWKNLMHHYLLERRTLKRILLLLDARHGFKKTDFDFLGDLQDGLMAKVEDDGKKAKRELPPIQIILTKCDLVKQTDLARRVVVVRKQLSDFLVREPSQLPVMLVSARAGVGFNNIRKETPMGGVLELQRELASLVPIPRATRARGRKK